MKPGEELPPQLNPDNSAFAHKTIKERWPVIIAQVIDCFYRNREYFCDTMGIPAEALKSLTGAISQLRYEVTTNKPITLLHTELINQEELVIWNRNLQAAGVQLKQWDNLKEACDQPSWYSLPWLLTECYLYRRIMDCAALTGLGSFDPFMFKKQSGLQRSQTLIRRLFDALERLPTDIQEARSESLFQMFIHASLWANEFDLSLNAGEDVSVNVTVSLAEHTKSLMKQVVVNNTHELYRIWMSRLCDSRSSGIDKPHTVALILDNAGPELTADLCLAEYLINSGLTTKVAFYPKVIPWYVSDVTPSDITWLLDVGLSAQFLSESLGTLAAKWADRWRTRFARGEFDVKHSPFWTYSSAYGDMAKIDADLHKELTTRSDVILFKGDLNYRKLVADRAWRPDSVVQKQAAFRSLQFGRPINSSGQLTCSCSPCTAPGDPLDCRCLIQTSETWPPLLCALRISKADVAVGLTPELLNRVLAESKDWWIIGRYGLIQIVSPIQL